MPPSGPMTAPENRQTRGITIAIGRRRQSIFETSPARLSSIDPSRLVGACRYLTRSPTTSENGRQMTGNIHGFATTKSFSQISLFSVSKNGQPGEHRDGADDRDDHHVDIRVDGLRRGDRGLIVIARRSGAGDRSQGPCGVAGPIGHVRPPGAAACLVARRDE